MAQVEFSSLQGEIAPDLPGVNAPAVARCARLAARYFCEETGVLKHTYAPFDIVANQATYALAPPGTALAITFVEEVWVGETKLIHRSSDQFDREEGQPEERNAFSVGMSGVTFNSDSTPWRLFTEYPPRFYFQETPQSIRLVGIPDQDVAGALEVTVCVKPGLGATSIDSLIVDQWYETLVLGTKAFLLQTRQKPWTDIKEGVARQREFEAEVAKIRGDMAAGFAANAHVVGHVRAYP